MPANLLQNLPWLALARVRSAGYAIEGTMLFLVMSGFNRALPGGRKFMKPLGPETYQKIYAELDGFLKTDADNIRKGLYPAAVLWPESPFEHFWRFPRIVLDGFRASIRRTRGKTSVFGAEAQDQLDDVPRYYRRNFHFQADGYLSDKSAELYEHQVEILFIGAADAMRRLVIQALRQKFGTGNGVGLRFLEVGAGTGRATRFVKLAFPKAHVTAVDLSDPYLKKAQDELKGFRGIDFVRADGARLPFQDGGYDAAYSIFLFHELPLEERKAVLRESARVVKPGGLLAMVDSVQTGDVARLPEIEEMLSRFPEDFHEPFYRNYLETPVAPLLTEVGVRSPQTKFGFLSKLCFGSKA